MTKHELEHSGNQLTRCTRYTQYNHLAEPLCFCDTMLADVHSMLTSSACQLNVNKIKVQENVWKSFDVILTSCQHAVNICQYSMSQNYSGSAMHVNGTMISQEILFFCSVT